MSAFKSERRSISWGLLQIVALSFAPQACSGGHEQEIPLLHPALLVGFCFYSCK